MPYYESGRQYIRLVIHEKQDKTNNKPTIQTEPLVLNVHWFIIQLRRSSILICFRDACQIIIVQLIQTNQLVDVGCPSGSWTAF